MRCFLRDRKEASSQKRLGEHVERLKLTKVSDLRDRTSIRQLSRGQTHGIHYDDGADDTHVQSPSEACRLSVREIERLQDNPGCSGARYHKLCIHNPHAACGRQYLLLDASLDNLARNARAIAMMKVGERMTIVFADEQSPRYRFCKRSLPWAWHGLDNP